MLSPDEIMERVRAFLAVSEKFPARKINMGVELHEIAKTTRMRLQNGLGRAREDEAVVPYLFDLLEAYLAVEKALEVPVTPDQFREYAARVIFHAEPEDGHS